MTNHILLRLRSHNLIRKAFMSLCFLPVIGLAQATTPETKSEPREKILAAPTQQISRARSGYVSEADVEDVPATPTCGPSWLGGCWDVHQPQRSYGETFKSPLFYAPFFGLLATNAIDIEATRASGCGEAHEFGKKPSRLEQYGQDFAADAAVGTLAFFLHRAHIKVIPQAMLGYGIGIHIHGAIRGFNANCR